MVKVKTDTLLPTDPSIFLFLPPLTHLFFFFISANFYPFPRLPYRLRQAPSFMVVAEEYRPHVVVENTAFGEPVSVVGPMVNLLSVMAEAMNFT